MNVRTTTEHRPITGENKVEVASTSPSAPVSTQPKSNTQTSLAVDDGPSTARPDVQLHLGFFDKKHRAKLLPRLNLTKKQLKKLELSDYPMVSRTTVESLGDPSLLAHFDKQIQNLELMKSDPEGFRRLSNLLKVGGTAVSALIYGILGAIGMWVSTAALGTGLPALAIPAYGCYVAYKGFREYDKVFRFIAQGAQALPTTTSDSPGSASKTS